MGQLVKVNFRLARRDKTPISGADILVQIVDQDPLSDDLLGTCGVDATGAGELMFDLDLASSADSPLEMQPDVYLKVFRNGALIYRSDVKLDVDFLAVHPVTGMANSLTKDLGVFIVE